eukprot:6095620-Prymnesium_polylepis.1
MSAQGLAVGSVLTAPARNVQGVTTIPRCACNAAAYAKTRGSSAGAKLRGAAKKASSQAASGARRIET